MFHALEDLQLRANQYRYSYCFTPIDKLYVLDPIPQIPCRLDLEFVAVDQEQLNELLIR